MSAARRSLACCLGVAAGLIALFVTAPTFAGKADNSVRFASDQTLSTVDPYFNIQGVGAIVAENVWDTLIYRDPKTGDFKGNLATAWRWADDRRLEVDLREGVRFHNGAAFTADDVVYTLNLVSKPESKIVNLTLVHWIDHVEKIGLYRVRIVAKEPFPPAIAYLASPLLVIHPHDYYAKLGPRRLNEKPVGSGPFRVVDYALGKYIRLERNPDYFKDGPKSLPKIDRVEIRFIPDAQTRVAEIVSGGLDLIMNVSPDQAEQLRDISNLQIAPTETIRFAHLRLNTLQGMPAPQLRDVRVRQAIMHAIDREAMVKFLVGDGPRLLGAECYPSQFGCDGAGLLRYDYDPDKARQLLAEAGFPKGFAVDLYANRDRNQTEAIIGYLRAIGIRARLRFLQAAAFTSVRRAGRMALAHTTELSSFINDVSASVSLYYEFSADDMNRDPEIRDLLRRGDSSLDTEVRKLAYAAAFKLIAERAYALPLYTLLNEYIAAKGLVFKPDPLEIPRFYEMSWE